MKNLTLTFESLTFFVDTQTHKHTHTHTHKQTNKQTRLYTSLPSAGSKNLSYTIHLYTGAETGCIFGTKSPNLGKREFWTKIGQRHFSPLMVPYLHAKYQKNS